MTDKMNYDEFRALCERVADRAVISQAAMDMIPVNEMSERVAKTRAKATGDLHPLPQYLATADMWASFILGALEELGYRILSPGEQP